MEKITKGLVTVPTDESYVEKTKEFIKLWGADAVRDCDGVSLPKDLKQFGCEAYKAYFIVREDREYAKNHKEFWQNAALCTKRYLATESELEIDVLDGIFRESFEPNDKSAEKYWQVFDRTTGCIHDDREFLGGHNGGDFAIMNDLIRYLNGERTSLSITTLDDSVNGHLCVFAAEESRKEEKVVRL